MAARVFRWIFRLFTLLALLNLLASCATTAKGGTEEGRVYSGRGSGDSPLVALNAAKMDAVRLAVADMIGREKADAHRAEIDSALSSAENPNAYVYNETLKILQTGESPISYVVQIRVNTVAVRSLLGSLGIAEAENLRAGEGQAAREAVAQSAQTTAGEADAGSEGEAEIERDLDQLTYMVYYEASSENDPFIMQSAVNSADSYLADNGLAYIDRQQIESLVADQEKVYEDETHKSLGIIQWVAQKLHADIYIVVEAQASFETRNGKHYGSANVTLRSFDSSTGIGRGASNYASIQPSVSLVSGQDAVLNAVNSAAYKAIGEAVRQARAYMVRELRDGIAYDLIMVNTPNDRVMSSFMKDLRRRVREVRLLTSSNEETRYRVVVSGTAADLQDLVYRSASNTPGLEGVRLVLLRGRELTFDTGS